MSDTLQLVNRLEKVLSVKSKEIPVVKSNPTHRAILIESLSRRIPVILAKKADKYAKIKALHDKVRDKAEKIYTIALNSLLKDAQSEVMLNIRAQDDVSGVLTSKVRIDDFLRAETDTTTPVDVNFDLKKFTAKFKASMAKAAQEAYSVCALGLIDDQDEDLKSRVTDQGIIQKFEFARANKLKNCPQEIFDSIQNTLTEGDAAGETMIELGERVQSEFKGISEGRAYVIARTESQSAYGSAQMGVLKGSGYATKFWQTSDDELVRPSHVECEEEGNIDIDGEFSNDLAFPGDPNGEAAEVIGCRCYLISKEAGEEDEEGDDE